MKQGTSKALILIVMLASTIAAMVLRQMQLIRVFDADGLPISGSPITYALAAICVVTLAALLLLLRRTPPRQEYYCSIFLTLPGMILTLLAALAVGVGSLIQFGDSIALTPALTSEAESIHWSHLILPIGGILTALCILLTVNRMANMRRPLLALYLVPFAFIVVYLVLEFKNQWSADPIILDYCFYLFALICTMYALYYVMGFCFDRGRRRHAIFWCLAGFFFCLVSVLGSDASRFTFYGGLGLWMLSLAIPLLTDKIPDYVKHPDEAEAEEKRIAAEKAALKAQEEMDKTETDP